jgi:hypothetical protein
MVNAHCVKAMAIGTCNYFSGYLFAYFPRHEGLAYPRTFSALEATTNDRAGKGAKSCIVDLVTSSCTYFHFFSFGKEYLRQHDQGGLSSPPLPIEYMFPGQDCAGE